MRSHVTRAEALALGMTIDDSCNPPVAYIDGEVLLHRMAARGHAEDACQAVDAMVFSGDALHDAATRACFVEYLERWGRAVREFEAQALAEQQSAQADR